LELPHSFSAITLDIGSVEEEESRLGPVSLSRLISQPVNRHNHPRVGLQFGVSVVERINHFQLALNHYFPNSMRKKSVLYQEEWKWLMIRIASLFLQCLRSALQFQLNWTTELVRFQRLQLDLEV
jgi:hypothetical protein